MGLCIISKSRFHRERRLDSNPSEAVLQYSGPLSQVSVRTTAPEVLRLKLTAQNIPLMPVHAYEVRQRRDHRGVNLISNVLPFGRLWYGEPNAVSNAV
jgi:hypothetical protein